MRQARFFGRERIESILQVKKWVRPSPHSSSSWHFGLFCGVSRMRLYVISLLPFLAGVLGVPSIAIAEDFCALTVDVTRSTGRPVRRTWIQLKDATGLVVHAREVSGPTFTICDFGFGAHTLTVGSNECLPVTVSNLRLVLGSPIRLKVVLNPCTYSHPMRSGCLLYLRVADTGGNPIPGAELSMSAVPLIPERTDSYGRYQGLFSGQPTVVVTRDGFETGKANIQCRDDEQVDVQVVLQGKPAASPQSPPR